MNDRKRTGILIITPFVGHFIHDYVSNVLISRKYKVTILAISAQEPLKYYRENGICVVTLKKSPEDSGLRMLIHAFRVIQLQRKLMSDFDIVHVHYMDPKLLLICRPLIRKAGKLVLTFWGSDLLNSPQKDKRSYCYDLRRASVITVMSDQMMKKLSKEYHAEYDEKALVLDYGNSRFNRLDTLLINSGREACRKQWGIPDGKISVHVGYNGREEQQHIPLIQALERLTSEIRENLFLVVHFGYGKKSDLYEKMVKKTLDYSGFSYVLIDQFMNSEEIVSFRLSADVFLYGQITDAISSSILEYWYAGAAIIKPSWLDYKELENKGVKDYEYHEMKDIPNLLERVLLRRDLWETDAEKTRRVLRQEKSWDILRDIWRNLYE